MRCARIMTVLVLVLGACTSPKTTQKLAEHMELGWIDRQVLMNPPYTWFDSGYAEYQPSAEMLEDIRVQLDSVRFLVVLGTWCSDTKRELPRFFKILDHLHIRSDHIQLFAVDRTKHHPAGIPQQYSITNVPTIIVLQEGNELGRIVESPKTKLEFDLFEIVSSVMR